MRRTGGEPPKDVGNVKTKKFKTIPSKEAAVTLVDQIGVTNAIDSLKKTGEYENLDTPFARDFRELFGAGRRK